jgi:hypothetical protein
MRFHAFEDLVEFGGPFVCLFAVLLFILLVAFLAAVDRVLKRVEPENRRMDPSLVWLNVIPLFNFVWMIVTIERVGESIRNEFVARGRHRSNESYGKTAGLAFVILWDIGLPFAGNGIPCVFIFWFFAFIYWVVYWAQISGYAWRLRSTDSYSPPPDEGW